jgi:ribosome-binding protein aMBF1 (putative translation factor)
VGHRVGGQFAGDQDRVVGVTCTRSGSDKRCAAVRGVTALSERDRESVSLFVDEMKAAREQRGWSQAELGKQAGYSEGAADQAAEYHDPGRSLGCPQT